MGQRYARFPFAVSRAIYPDREIDGNLHKSKQICYGSDKGKEFYCRHDNLRL